MSLSLDTPVQFIKGVGPKLSDILRKKGIQTAQDFLEFYPRAYEDRRAARSIASLREDELVSLRAQVVRVSSFQMGRSSRKMHDVLLADHSGRIHCKFFRVPYRGYFERFQPNQTVRVIGKVTRYRGQIEFHHPDIQDDSGDDGVDQDRMIPIYPESEGITNRQIRKFIASVLEELKREPAALDSRARTKGSAISSLASLEKLPEWVRQQWGLLGRFEALEKLHLPPEDAGSDYVEQRSPYHRRIIFEEFFWLELYLAAKKSGLKKETAAVLEPRLELVDKLKASLPFQMTAAQTRALNDVVRDLGRPFPMHRLVQGDVGSGKTLVALASALVAAGNAFQSAIMVPTEILAEQHFAHARRFLEPLGLTVGLLTGSMKAAERNQTYEMLRQGLIHLVVGTHALIQESVEFKNLGLVIIDEQHRFGVHQRGELKGKGGSPHFLIMTATPIPRTLAMTAYGDLDTSIIDELPPGRTPIMTRVTYQSKREQILQFVREQLSKGRQAYIVYPLVEESEKMDLRDAVSACEQLRGELAPDYRVGLLHGKMKPDEKDEVMRRFREREFHVLVSTTVIEVGVDVPNANLMIIENAERFGLSQLHQLRGRVGRGQHKSYCVLVLGHAVSDESRERCRIMEQTTDGFKIAQADLEIRGPGEFLGARQSGLPGFKMANLVRDEAVLLEARAAAFEIFAKDPKLSDPQHRALREELVRTRGQTALASVG